MFFKISYLNKKYTCTSLLVPVDLFDHGHKKATIEIFSFIIWVVCSIGCAFLDWKNKSHDRKNRANLLYFGRFILYGTIIHPLMYVLSFPIVNLNTFLRNHLKHTFKIHINILMSINHITTVIVTWLDVRYRTNY